MSRRYQPLNTQHAKTIAGHAARMRHSSTASERALWAKLSGNQLGVSFRRQYVAGRFIADFAAPSIGLIVEVDGGYHIQRSRADADRDEKLRRLGWCVLRILAETVIGNAPAAVAAIREAVDERRLRC